MRKLKAPKPKMSSYPKTPTVKKPTSPKMPKKGKC